MKHDTQLSLAASLIAFCLACMLIPHAGLESDEAVFGLATFGGLPREFSISVFRHQFPLMIFYYAGSLKGLLYWPVLHLFGPNVWSIRLPMALAGAATVALTFDFVRHISSRTVAAIAALMLATDPCFLITNTFDWGPVAMEHLLLMSSLALFARRRPQLACFVLGLGLWNKAVFIWALTGVAAGGLLAYLPAVRRSLPDTRAVLRCALAFVLGCMPLALYNIRRPASTLRSNVHLSFEGFQAKVATLRYLLDGSDLFGVVTRMDGVADHSGPQFHGLFLPAVLASIAVCVWKMRSSEFKPALFASAFCTGSLLLISITKYTGAAHHMVLLYPMPQLLVAIAVRSVRRKYLPALAASILVSANLLVFHTYLNQLQRTGGAGLFTDAISTLSMTVTDGADHVYTIDYGLYENLWLLHSGRLQVQPLWTLGQPVTETEQTLHDPRALFVDHVPGREYYPGRANVWMRLQAGSDYEELRCKPFMIREGVPSCRYSATAPDLSRNSPPGSHSNFVFLPDYRSVSRNTFSSTPRPAQQPASLPFMTTANTLFTPCCAARVAISS